MKGDHVQSDQKQSAWSAWKRGVAVLSTISLFILVGLTMVMIVALGAVSLYTALFGGSYDDLAIYYLTPLGAIILVPIVIGADGFWDRMLPDIIEIWEGEKQG